LKTTFEDRVFQLWEYKVSHGSLLIRSPKVADILENVDLICTGVEYVAVPRHMKGLDLVEATSEEVINLSQLLGKELETNHIRVIVSGGRRFPVVAASFRFSKNTDDIFASPFA
jgi:hypothetical protein